jgi:hypothetical protein
MDQVMYYAAFDLASNIDVRRYNKYVVDEHVETVVRFILCIHPTSFCYHAFSNPSSYQTCSSEGEILWENAEIEQTLSAIARQVIVGEE